MKKEWKNLGRFKCTCICIIFIFCMCNFLCFFTVDAKNDSTQELNKTLNVNNKTLNPEWVKYNSLTVEEKVKYQIIPSMYLEDNEVENFFSEYKNINKSYETVSESYYNIYVYTKGSYLFRYPTDGKVSTGDLNGDGKLSFADVMKLANTMM